MNKIIATIALVAFLGAVVSAQNDDFEINDEVTKLALFEDDDGETKGLSDEQQIFRQYCLDSRDKVKGYFKQAINEKTATAYKFVTELFAESASAVGAKGMSVANDGAAMIQADAKMIASAFRIIADAIADSANSSVTNL
jgi:nitrogen fixation-related uncharacterized protein